MSYPLQRFNGHYWIKDGWYALLGQTEWTKNDLEKIDLDKETPEQAAEITKALTDFPPDTQKPKRGQRRKFVAAEGQMDDEVPDTTTLDEIEG